MRGTRRVGVLSRSVLERAAGQAGELRSIPETVTELEPQTSALHQKQPFDHRPQDRRARRFDGISR